MKFLFPCMFIFYSSLCRAAAEPDSLTMFVWSNQLAPIITHQDLDKKSGDINEYQGIVVDVLSSMLKKEDININVYLNSRRRGEIELYQGRADLTILSSPWLEFPKELIFSLPIYTHREYLYATKIIANEPLSDIIAGKRICTRLGYKYPKLAPYFEAQHALRLDNQEESAQFKMLKRGRCDFVLTNEFVANSIIQKNSWKGTVFQSEFSTDEVGFTIAFHPKHQDWIDRLNIHIVDLELSGELEKIVLRHTQP